MCDVHYIVHGERKPRISIEVWRATSKIFRPHDVTSGLEALRRRLATTLSGTLSGPYLVLGRELDLSQQCIHSDTEISILHGNFEIFRRYMEKFAISSLSKVVSFQHFGKIIFKSSVFLAFPGPTRKNTEIYVE